MTAQWEELLEGLPETLDALLEHPERHRPEVIERMLERSEELRREDLQRALALAEAAQRLSAKIPAFFPREERLRLRARSFQVWGGLKRALGDEEGAEGAYWAAFEILDRLGAAPEELAAVLGRHALLAGDRRDQTAVARYVEAGLQIAKDLEAESPLETIKPLFEAVMAEEGSILSAFYATLSVVANTTSIPVGGGGETVGHTTTHLELGEEGPEVVLRRHASASSGLPWKMSARIRLLGREACEIYLWREVPSAEAEGGWEIDDMIGWQLWATEAAMEAAEAAEAAAHDDSRR